MSCTRHRPATPLVALLIAVVVATTCLLPTVASARKGKRRRGKAVAKTAPAKQQEAGDGLSLVPTKQMIAAGDVKSVDIKISVVANVKVGEGLPLVSTSVGSIEKIRADGAGFVATFIPPQSKPPSAAIIIARLGTTNPIFGATTIQLVGKARVEVKTEPGATVRIKIAGKTFGPFEADEKGLMQTVLSVPPGKDQLEVFTFDKAKNRKRRRKTLDVPPFPRLHFAPGPTELVADGSVTATFAVASASATGELAPFRGKCHASAAQLEPVDAPGMVRQWRYRPKKVGGGELRVSCKASGRKIELIVRLEPGVIRSLEARPPESIASGESTPIVVVALDVAGNPQPDLSMLEVSADIGSATIETTPEGTSALIYRAPEKLPKSGSATIELRDPASGAAAQANINIRAGPVARIGLGNEGIVFQVNRGKQLRIPVDAADAFGNPIALEAPALEADVGSMTYEPPSDGGPGHVIYTSPGSPPTEMARLRISSGPAAAEIEVSLRSSWEHTDVSVRGGALVLRNGRFGPLAGLALTSALPLLDGALRVRVEVFGIFSTTRSALRVEPVRIGTVHQSLYMINPVLRIFYRFPLGGSVGLFGGLGGGATILFSVTEITGDANLIPPSHSKMIVSPIGSAQIGVDFGVGVGSVEVAFEFIAAMTKMHPGVRGDFGALLLTAGWQLGWPAALW